MRSVTASLLIALAAVLLTCGSSAAGVPCSGTSEVGAVTGSSSVGDTVGIYAIVRDCYGGPLGNMLCYFYSSRGDTDYVVGSPDSTDQNGLASAQITTGVAGPSRIWAECQGVTLGPSDYIVWIPAEGLKIDGLLWGNINSTDFTAQAVGTVDTTTGFLCGDVTFSEVIPDFHPAFTLKCLLCLVCRVSAKAINGGISLYELSGWDYSLESTLYYPTGDSLWTSSTIWLSGDTVRYESEWYGTYAGPTDLVGVPPFNQVFRPAGPGRISFTGNGDVVESGAGWVHVTWCGSYTSADSVELPFAEVSTTDHSFTWDGTTYHVEGYSTIEPLPPSLLDVTCILQGDSAHAVVFREGQEFPLSAVPCLTAGDVMTTHSDRVQLTDGEGYHFRVGSNTITRYGVYPCLEEDYAIHLNLGEIYAAHKCIHLRSTRWVRHSVEAVTYFVKQDYDLTSHFLALAGSLAVVTYFPGCVDSFLFETEDGMQAITTGYAGDPGAGVIFEPISHEDSAYILQTYVSDWASVEHEDEPPVPSSLALIRNYPNPFKASTEIKYTLPVDCHVSLQVYDLKGQKVATLVEGHQRAGHWTVRWGPRSELGSEVASGIYFCRLKAGGFLETRKMVMIK